MDETVTNIREYAEKMSVKILFMPNLLRVKARGFNQSAGIEK